jgi:hypothetical protein
VELIKNIEKDINDKLVEFKLNEEEVLENVNK